MLNIELEYKVRVISRVLLATINNPVDARTMWAEWNVNGKHSISIEGWQRIVTKIIENYQHEQLERAERGEKFNLILSSPNGYYCSKNKEDAIKGILFYQKRFEPMFKRRKLLKNLIKKKYELNIDRYEQPGQVKLFN